MVDVFEHKILCKKCDSLMEPATVIRNGFKLRALICPHGHDKLIHPADEEEYKRFKELRGKEFRVKMRIVGNSYAVSIPKEIVSFMSERSQRLITNSKLDNLEQEQEKFMNDMVRLCFEDAGKLSLTFNDIKEKKGEELK